MAINWQQVDAPNFGQAATMLDNGADKLASSFKNIAGAFDPIRAAAAARRKEAIEKNTLAEINTINQIRDVEALKQHVAGLNNDALVSRYGEDVDLAKVLTYAANAPKTLQDSLISDVNYQKTMTQNAEEVKANDLLERILRGQTSGNIAEIQAAQEEAAGLDLLGKQVTQAGYEAAKDIRQEERNKISDSREAWRYKNEQTEAARRDEEYASKSGLRAQELKNQMVKAEAEGDEAAVQRLDASLKKEEASTYRDYDQQVSSVKSIEDLDKLSDLTKQNIKSSLGNQLQNKITNKRIELLDAKLKESNSDVLIKQNKAKLTTLELAERDRRLAEARNAFMLKVNNEAKTAKNDLNFERTKVSELVEQEFYKKASTEERKAMLQEMGQQYGYEKVGQGVLEQQEIANMKAELQIHLAEEDRLAKKDLEIRQKTIDELRGSMKDPEAKLGFEGYYKNLYQTYSKGKDSDGDPIGVTPEGYEQSRENLQTAVNTVKQDLIRQNRTLDEGSRLTEEQIEAKITPEVIYAALKNASPDDETFFDFTLVFETEDLVTGIKKAMAAESMAKKEEDKLAQERYKYELDKLKTVKQANENLTKFSLSPEESVKRALTGGKN